MNYEYMICNTADEGLYEKQCTAIEKHVPGIKKQEELIDVDGSRIQRYIYNGEEIVVINSIYENELIVKSTEDIKRYFS